VPKGVWLEDVPEEVVLVGMLEPVFEAVSVGKVTAVAVEDIDATDIIDVLELRIIDFRLMAIQGLKLFLSLRFDFQYFRIHWNILFSVSYTIHPLYFSESRISVNTFDDRLSPSDICPYSWCLSSLEPWYLSPEVEFLRHSGYITGISHKDLHSPSRHLTICPKMCYIVCPVKMQLITSMSRSGS
jgi:hypothetical protein